MANKTKNKKKRLLLADEFVSQYSYIVLVFKCYDTSNGSSFSNFTFCFLVILFAWAHKQLCFTCIDLPFKKIEIS